MSGLTKLDGFDDCVVGVVERIGMESIICYDKTKVLAKMVEEGMEEEDALEYFEYSMVGAYIGEFTPCFITPYESLNELLDNEAHYDV